LIESRITRFGFHNEGIFANQPRNIYGLIYLK